MRILLVTYWSLSTIGGIRTYMCQLAASLRKEGHQVDMMGTDLADHSVYVEGRTQRFHKSKILPLIRNNLFVAPLPTLHASPEAMTIESDRYAFEMGAAFLGLDQYDLIHAQDPIAAVCIRRVLTQSTPLLVSFHGSLAREGYLDTRSVRTELRWDDFRNTTYGKHYQALEYWGAVSADHILVSSKWIGELITSTGIPETKLTRIPYGVDISTFFNRALVPFPMPKPRGKKLIMYTGRLEYVKGVQVLIEALGFLHNKRQDFECWIVGEGTLQATLEHRCRVLGIDHIVKFIGNVTNVPSILQKADLYVQPSLQDTQPFSLTEAQLAGIPCIGSNVTGIPEMIKEGVTGLLFESDQPASLSQHIHLLFNEPKLAKEIGEQARQWVLQHRRLEHMYHDTHALYTQMIGGTRVGAQSTQ